MNTRKVLLEKCICLSRFEGMTRIPEKLWQEICNLGGNKIDGIKVILRERGYYKNKGDKE